MATNSANTTDHAQIRKLIESCAEAIRAKDPEAVAAHYTDDLVAFDMAPPLRVGVQHYKENYARWFASLEGPIDYQLGNVQIAASGDAGFCSMVNRVRSTAKSGEQHDGWVRVTLGLRKVDGEWRAAHEHVSVPFDMATGKALMNLTP